MRVCAYGVRVCAYGVRMRTYLEAFVQRDNFLPLLNTSKHVEPLVSRDDLIVRCTVVGHRILSMNPLFMRWWLCNFLMANTSHLNKILCCFLFSFRASTVATHPQMDVVFLADHLGRVPSALLLDHLGAGFVVWEEGLVVSWQWSCLMKKHRSKIVLLCICVVRNEHSSLRMEDSSPRQGWVVGRQTPG